MIGIDQISYTREENDRIRRSPFIAFPDTAWNRVRIVGDLREEPHLINRVIIAAATFDGFDDEADPAGTHDRATFVIDGVDFAFRIEYYDKELQRRSESSGNAYETRRVLNYGYAKDLK